MNYEEEIKKISKLESRPLKFGEIALILARYDIMIKDKSAYQHSIDEFIVQEHFRRTIFKK